MGFFHSAFAEIIREGYIEPVPVSTDCSRLWDFQQVRGKWSLCKPSQKMGDASVQSAWPVWSVARQRPPPLPSGLQIWHSSCHSNVHSDVCSGRAQRGM